MKKAFAWSYSALTNFESCPKKHWHLRVQKDYREEENENIKYGHYVHKALENFCLKGTPLPIDLAHLEKHVAKYRDIPLEKMAEQKLAINADYEPTGWFDPDVYCRAVLDLVVFGETHAVIVDWKTGKEVDDNIQLQLMAALLFLYKPQLETIDAAFFYTKTKRSVPSSISRDEIPAIWSAIIPRVRRLEEAILRTDFPPKPSGLCKRHCPITGCPYHGDPT